MTSPPPELSETLRLLLENPDPRLDRFLRMFARPGGPTRRQLLAYYLVDVLGKTFREAADEMGITPQSVHALVVRARRKQAGIGK